MHGRTECCRDSCLRDSSLELPLPDPPLHPAYSVIFFTTASGAGYGLLMFIASFALLGLVPIERSVGLLVIGIGSALVVLGLLASTAHLGRPERAWRAFSEWRTSWLSREGVAAVLSLCASTVLMLVWASTAQLTVSFAVAAIATLALAVTTLVCTGMIYASLRTIPAWHQPLTVPIYLALALATGGILLHLLLALTGQNAQAAAIAGLVATVVAGVLKLAYWSARKRPATRPTIESATGLGRFGKVRPLDPPHTQPNYVMREMGYRVGRKHAARLRRMVLVLLFVLPCLCLTFAIWVKGAGSVALGAFATLAAGLGVVIERWLFFAEAEHFAMLYYSGEPQR